MFVASTALTGNTPLSCILNACAVGGVIGVICASAAESLLARGVHAGAMGMLLVSYACAVAGALGIVAGTQSWEVTLVAGICTAGIFIVVIWPMMRGRARIADMEAGIERSVVPYQH